MTRARRTEATYVWLFAISLTVGVLALALRGHALGRESLWLDEGFTWERSSLPLPALIQHAIRGHHNPTYFVVLHYWLAFGDDEFMMRFPSALAGALAAGAGVWLGYVLHGLAAGFVAGFLLALAPQQIQYGQEARMYSLLCFTATTAMVGLVYLIRNPARAAQPILGTRKLWAADSAPAAVACPAAWIAYTLGTIGSLYMHNTTVVFAVGAGLAMLAACIGLGRIGLRIIANFVAANIIVIAVWALYLGTELQQAKAFADATFWAKFPTTHELGVIARELYLMTAQIPSLLAVLLAAAALAGLWALRTQPRVMLAMVLLCSTGPGLLLLVSLYKPIFGARMLLWAAAPFAALVGAGVASIRHIFAAIGFSAVVALLVWPTLELQYVRVDKEPWRELVKTIEARARPGAITVAASSEEAMMLSYYRQRRSFPIGTFPFAAAQHKLPPEADKAPSVFLLDRKGGARIKRWVKHLEAKGYAAVQTHAFRNLRLIELSRRE